MPKQPSTKVLKTCRIEKQFIEYCTMQNINFNGLVNELLKLFVKSHQRDCVIDTRFENIWIALNTTKDVNP